MCMGFPCCVLAQIRHYAEVGLLEEEDEWWQDIAMRTS